MPTGQCNCGAIGVTIPEYGTPSSNSTLLCHCANCRNQGGGLGSAVMLLDDGDIVVSGATLTTYNDPNTASGNIMRRTFCERCGSGIVSRADIMPGKGFVKMGLFARPYPKADAEIFIARNNPWEPQVAGAMQANEGV